MKTQIIQLESHDDLISARDKMAWSKAPRILLVWPRKGLVLERELDLVMLQRYAHSLGAQFGVVTSSGSVRLNARAAGVPAFRTLTQAQRGSWRRPRGKRRLNLALLDRKVDPVGLRARLGSFRQAKIEKPWVRAGAFLAGVLAIFALLLFSIPSARLELTPQRQDQHLALDLHASPAIQEANLAGGLPAYPVVVTVEGSDQLPSSGSASVPDLPAEGEVEFGNLTTADLAIPAGTVIATLDNPPLRYETRRDALLPAGVGQKTSVGVRALIPGKKGNVPVGSLRAVEGSIGLQAEVTNPGSMHGGTDRISPAPTEKDYAALREKLNEALLLTAGADMARQLKDGQRLLKGTLSEGKIIKETLDPEAGQPGDYARMNLQLEFSAWYVLDQDLEKIARPAMEANCPAGFVPLNPAVTVNFDSPAALQADGSAAWKASAVRELEADWNNQSVARSVVGLEPGQAARFLAKELALASAPQVVLMPAWWVRMPFLSFRIDVVRR